MATTNYFHENVFTAPSCFFRYQHILLECVVAIQIVSCRFMDTQSVCMLVWSITLRVIWRIEATSADKLHANFGLCL